MQFHIRAMFGMAPCGTGCNFPSLASMAGIHLMRNKSADWFAWILQFVFGFAFGAAVCLRITLESAFGESGWLALVCGAGLIGAGLASFYGDRLWNNHYRVIPPDEMQHSSPSRVASIVSGSAGAILFVGGILWPVLIKAS